MIWVLIISVICSAEALKSSFPLRPQEYGVDMVIGTCTYDSSEISEPDKLPSFYKLYTFDDTKTYPITKNDGVIGAFSETGRYKLNYTKTNDDSTVIKLTIENARVEDSGTIGCGFINSTLFVTKSNAIVFNIEHVGIPLNAIAFNIEPKFVKDVEVYEGFSGNKFTAANSTIKANISKTTYTAGDEFFAVCRGEIYVNLATSISVKGSIELGYNSNVDNIIYFDTSRYSILIITSDSKPGLRIDLSKKFIKTEKPLTLDWTNNKGKVNCLVKNPLNPKSEVKTVSETMNVQHKPVFVNEPNTTKINETAYEAMIEIRSNPTDGLTLTCNCGSDSNFTNNNDSMKYKLIETISDVNKIYKLTLYQVQQPNYYLLCSSSNSIGASDNQVWKISSNVNSAPALVINLVFLLVICFGTSTFF